MKVKRIVFVNRAPFKNIDIDFSDSQVVSLTGINDYGKVVTTRELDKMKMCDYICELDGDSQKIILSNLKPIIERIVTRAKQHMATD